MARSRISLLAEQTGIPADTLRALERKTGKKLHIGSRKYQRRVQNAGGIEYDVMGTAGRAHLYRNAAEAAVHEPGPTTTRRAPRRHTPRVGS